jgi:REP element-mobilizing transposase RayT
VSESRPNESPLSESLAIFLTWPTYGTWLPGDERGWNKYKQGRFAGDAARKIDAEKRMVNEACSLTEEERELVQSTIKEHCAIKGWLLYAVNCRTTHIHVVVGCRTPAREIRRQLKAWTSRRLRERQLSMHVDPAKIRSDWWAERGSIRYLHDQKSLESVIYYVNEAQ